MKKPAVDSSIGCEVTQGKSGVASVAGALQREKAQPSLRVQQVSILHSVCRPTQTFLVPRDLLTPK